MKNIVLTLYYGHAEGGPKTREFDTIAEAEAYMATIGRVQITSGQEPPRRYIVFTENSRGIPCRITRDNTPLFVNHSVSDTNDNYEQEIEAYQSFLSHSPYTDMDAKMGMRHFRDTIHAREMAKKGAEIERQKNLVELITRSKNETVGAIGELTEWVVNNLPQMGNVGRSIHEVIPEEFAKKQAEIERLKNSIHAATSRLKAICQNRRISESDQEKILSAFTKTDNP